MLDLKDSVQKRQLTGFEVEVLLRFSFDLDAVEVGAATPAGCFLPGTGAEVGAFAERVVVAVAAVGFGLCLASTSSFSRNGIVEEEDWDSVVCAVAYP